MGHLWERLYPVIGGLAALAAYSAWRGQDPVPKGTDALLAASVSVAAIAVGFLGTTKSILVSIEGRRPVKLLRKLGRYDDLLSYVMDATHFGFLVAALSALGLVLDLTSGWRGSGLYFSLWVGTATTLLLGWFRVADLLAFLMRRLGDGPSQSKRPPPPPPPESGRC